MKKKNKIHIYYILLGVGIGLILGSIINIISPNVKYREYTEKEIRQKARELGMYDLDEIIEMNNMFNGEHEKNLENQSSNKENNNDNSDIENSNRIDQKDETKIQEKENVLESNQEENVNNDNGNLETEAEIKKDTNESESVEYVEFEVERGDSSEKVINNLFEANIIDNKEEFTNAVIIRKAGRKFHYGTFTIPKEVDYETLIDILTSK